MLKRLLQMAHFSVGICFLQTLQTGVLFGFFCIGSSSSELSSSATKLSSFFAVLARGEPFLGDGFDMGLDIHAVKAVSSSAAVRPRRGPSKAGSFATASKSSPPCLCKAGRSHASPST